MTYEQLQSNFGFTDFLTGNTILESGSVEQNINGDGKLTLSWRSMTGGVIAAGTTLETSFGTYVMLESYTPTVNDDGTYTFSPSFTSRDSLASKTLFWMTLQDSENTDMRLYTFPYTGVASTLISALGQHGWEVNVGNEIDTSQMITVSFDCDSVKSAAEKIAAALGTNAYFVKGAICIGTSEAYSAESYYNYFVVLGGTRNMGKRLLKGSYAQVTQRLMLEPGAAFDVETEVGAGSVIDLSGMEPKMMKLLIFDDVYPKMELIISETIHRRCWLMDEGGNKVVDHWELQRNGVWVSTVEMDGQTVPVTSSMEGARPVYKQYTKWYVKLSKEVGGVMTPYTIPLGDVIENKPLGLQFQSGALAGREFDLAAFTEPTSEHMDDDVSAGSFTATPDMYRIIMVADGSQLLPGNTTLIPSAGDRVTPLNVKFDGTYTETAQAELLERARSVIPMFHTQKPSSFQAQRSWGDFLTGGGVTPEIGDAYGNVGAATGAGYIVTSVVTDLMTGAARITYGTFKRRGILSSLAEKIDSVQLAGGQATAGQVDDGVRHTAPVGIDQYNALRSAGGSLGMKTVNRRITELGEELASYGSDMTAVKEQSDKRFDIFFGFGTPTSSNYPASDWDTESERSEHVQDIYYDTNREAASTGGRAWRWILEGGVYKWVEITDADTLAALEKIADVASDGVLSAGTEKVRILGEWTAALNEYMKCLAAESTYGTSLAFTNMKAAFTRLGRMLNNDTNLTTLNGIPTETPAWLRDLTQSTKFENRHYTDGNNVLQDMTSDYYRATWDNWYEKLAALKFSITGQLTTEARSKMQFFGSPTLPSGYKVGDMWRKDGTNFICISVAGQDMTDWQEVGANEDVFGSITNLLSELTVLLEETLTAALGYYGTGGRAYRDIRLFLKQSVPVDGVTKELWFNGSAFCQYDGTNWNGLTDAQGSTIFADSVELLTRIASVIGLDETITFRRLLTDGNATRNLYDVYFKRATFADKFTNEVMKGGLGIWIYGRHGWEHIMDDTTGLLENYGDRIVAAVFGSETLQTLHVNSFASAMVTSKNALQLFSQMTTEGKTLAEALFALGADVKYYYKNSNNAAVEVVKSGNGWQEAVSGNAYTGDVRDIYAVGETNAKLSADKINFDGKHISFNGTGGNHSSIMIGLTPSQFAYHGNTYNIGDAVMTFSNNGSEYIRMGLKFDSGLRVFLDLRGTISGHSVESDDGFYVADPESAEGSMLHGVTDEINAGDATLKFVGGILVESWDN